MAECSPQSRNGDFPDKICRILLVGKTGVGKSSTGNHLLDLQDADATDADTLNKGFIVGRGMSSQTRRCDMKEGKRGDLLIRVTDTPGLEDTSRTPEEIYREIATTLTFTNPGPHVILFVYKYERFTKKNYKVYADLKQLLGDNIKQYIIVLFTHVEKLLYGDQNDLCKELDKQIKKEPPALLLSVLKETDMRYFPFNNEARGDQMTQQVDKLFDMIFQLVSLNKGGYFECCFTEGINKELDKMLAEKMMSPKVQESKRKMEELQNKIKELEMTKQKNLEAKDRKDPVEIENLRSHSNQLMLSMQQNAMRMLLAEISKGTRSPPQIIIVERKSRCNVM